MTPSGSLVARLVLVAAIWCAALLFAGGAGLSLLYRATVFGDVDDRLDGAVRALVANAEVDERGRARIADAPVDPRFGQTLSGRYWAVYEPGDETAPQVLAQSRSIWDGRLSQLQDIVLAARATPGVIQTASAIGPDNEPLRVRGQLISLGDPAISILVLAAEDRRPIDREVTRFALLAVWTLAGFAVALVLAVAAQIRWGLAPLFRMRDAVAAVRDGELERLDEAAPAELAPLARELNALIDQNRAIVERARAHVGNLAHALKTPIAVLQNEARTQESALAITVRRQAEVMGRQVDHHLKRARAAASGHAFGARTPVDAVVQDLARTLPRMHPDKPVTLQVHGPRDVVFRGERQDLDEILGNLLDNAFKWARSTVQLTVTVDLADGAFEVAVEDDGPGLPLEKRGEVVRRGARLDEAAPGSGLGLSIVDDLALAYGGGFELGDSDLGGLRASVVLPGAAQTSR